MPSFPPVLNQRGEADPALATRSRRSGRAHLVGGTVGAIGSPDVLQPVVAGNLAIAAGLEKGTPGVGQGAGPAIAPFLPAHPALHPALLLTVLPLLLLLNRHNRATLQKGWTWLLFTTGALVEPLRPRRHVIHDRRYLDQMLEAEFGADRDAGPDGSRRRPRRSSSGSGGEGSPSRQSGSRDGERPRRRSSDPGSSRGSSRSRQP